MRSMIRILMAMLLTLNFSFAEAEDVQSQSKNTMEELQSYQENDAGQGILKFIFLGGSDSFLDESLMSVLSRSLNFLALAMMSVLSIMGGATYIIQTANKGTPGGQVISSIWAPLRIATATILLIPLSSGYSTLQIGVYKVASAGNSNANYLMKSGIDYIYENGTYRPPLIKDSGPMIIGWIASDVCTQYINSAQNDSRVEPKYRTKNSITAVRSTYSYDYEEYENTIFSPDPRVGFCGGISIEIPRGNLTIPDKSGSDYITPEMIQPKFEALLKEFQPRITAIANAILSDEKALRMLQENGSSHQSNFEVAANDMPKKISGAANDYASITNEFNARLVSIIATSVNELAAKTAGKSWRDELISTGWPALGTLFWQTNQSQERINNLARIFTLHYNEPMLDDTYTKDPRFNEISMRIHGLNKSALEQRKGFNLDDGVLISIESSGADGSGDMIKSMLANIASPIVKSLMLGGADSDMITSMQYSGSVISTATEIAFAAVATGIATTGATKDTTIFAAEGAVNSAAAVPLAGALTGTGATAAAAAPVAASSFLARITEEAGGFIKYLLVPLVLSGFALAVVLPAIPLFFWLLGVVSWMLFFIECLLVSPMWLAAHGTAEKEGWGSEHTRQGYMLMIGLYLSPILRVAGFFACLIALRPLGLLVQFLASYLHGVVITGFVSPLILVGSAVMLAMFGYSICVRVFSLPNELFERGLRWINGGNEVTGDEKAEQTNRSIVAMGGGKAEGAANSALMRGSRGAPTSPTNAPSGSVS